MKKKSILVLSSLLCACLVLILFSCNKTESEFDFVIEQQEPPPPPATGQDTVITVTALLNGQPYSALGRALEPDSQMVISFMDMGTEGFLELRLGADTLGVYTMNRNISRHTAVYYRNLSDKISLKGFTSRATDSAGGQVIITAIDTVNHKIKGSFELYLASRTDTSKFLFRTGLFDIQYNYAEVTLNNNTILKNGTIEMSGLASGTPQVPNPTGLFSFEKDSMKVVLDLFSNYHGTGDYEATTQGGIKLTNLKNGKTYTSVSGKGNLTRFNYGEFLQATFEGELKSEDGELIRLSSGSFVLGNISY